MTNVFNKKDPLVDAVRQVMQHNDRERAAINSVNETFGVSSKRALPHERHAEYDAAVNKALNEAKIAPGDPRQKLDVHEPEKDELTKKDFAKLRSMKEGDETPMTPPMKKKPAGYAPKKMGAGFSSKLAAKGAAMSMKNVAEESEQINEAKYKAMKHPEDEHKSHVMKGKEVVKVLTAKDHGVGKHFAAAKKLAATMNKYKTTNEEAEQIDELSRKTLKSYSKKASDDAYAKNAASDAAAMTGNVKKADELGRKAQSRAIGRSTAQKKLGNIIRADGKTVKAKVMATEEQIDEISKKTLGSYTRRAAMDMYHRGADATSYGDASGKSENPGFKKRYSDMADNARRKASNRMVGIERATKKLAKEEVEQIDELKGYQGRKGQKLLNKVHDRAYERLEKAIGKKDTKTVRKNSEIMSNAWDRMKDVHEEEQIDELKKSTLSSYVKKASGDMAGKTAAQVALVSSSKGKGDPDLKRGLVNRMKGISRAADKLAKEEVEQIDEKALSRAQQRFFGLVRGIQKGKAKGSAEATKAASEMSTKSVRDYAETKHKGLPEKKKEEK